MRSTTALFCRRKNDAEVILSSCSHGKLRTGGTVAQRHTAITKNKQRQPPHRAGYSTYLADVQGGEGLQAGKGGHLQGRQTGARKLAAGRRATWQDNVLGQRDGMAWYSGVGNVVE